MYSLEQLRDLGLQLIQLDDGLFTVVTAYQNALTGFNIPGTDLQTQRNTLHLILGILPAGGVIRYIGLDTAESRQLLTQFLGLFQNAGLVLGLSLIHISRNSVSHSKGA